MKFATRAAIAAVCAAIALAPAAGASGLNDCIQLGKQVSAALSGAAAGANVSQARNEARSAQTFCAAGMYAQGVARYSKALQLLGK